MDAQAYEELYRYYERTHPDWSVDQIRAMIHLNGLMEEMPSGSQGQEIGTDFLRTVLIRWGDWLKKKSPDIYQKVSSALERAIAYLSNLIRIGIQKINDLLSSIFAFFD